MTDPPFETMPGLSAPAATARELTEYIRDRVAGEQADTVVVELDGQVASTVTAILAVESVGSPQVCGLVVQPGDERSGDVNEARQVAEELVIDYRLLDIQGDSKQLRKRLTPDELSASGGSAASLERHQAARDSRRGTVGDIDQEMWLTGQLHALARRFEALHRNGLVLGTGIRTDRWLSSRGGVGVLRTGDVLPVGDLYFSQLRVLAQHLDIRPRIIQRSATDSGWLAPMKPASEPPGFETVDGIVYWLKERQASISEVAAAFDIDRAVVKRLEEVTQESAGPLAAPTTPSSSLLTLENE